jgi:hypothetical protein
MFSSLEKKCLEEIDVVRLLIDVHNENSSAREAQLRKRMKVYSVSSCVTRLYAIYERFVETAVSDYLDALSDCASFESLSAGFKNEYRMGISHILSKIDQGRYDHLNHEEVVKWYYGAITNGQPYRFVTDALTRHEENLRIQAVENILNKIQLTDLGRWLAVHPKLKELYPDELSFYPQLEAEVRSFVQLRNDASHGTLEDLEGRDNLIRLCDLTNNLIVAIAAYLRKSLIIQLEQAGKIKKIGAITESFTNGAFVFKAKNGVSVKVGSTIYILAKANCQPETINSIMINDASVQEITSSSDDFEIGLKCNSTVKKESVIYQRLP